MSADHGIARAMAEAAQAINVHGTLTDTLDAVAHAAREAVPGFDHVGISVVQSDGTVATVAATSPLVIDMDTLQYELGQGPCLSALSEATLVLAEDLPHEQRWPRYVPRSVKSGARAQMGVQLFASDEPLGGLNFYSTLTGAIDPEAPRRAELFATHAALALSHARRADRAAEAVPTRQLIGQAVGILMERFELTEDRAMYYLVKIAAAGRLQLRDVAREVVDQVTLRARKHDPGAG